jgi:hypothetical protein
MKHVAISIGSYKNADLQAMVRNMAQSQVQAYVISEVPGQGGGRSRRDHVAGLKNGDCLYLVAHGNGNEWGTSGKEVGVSQHEMVEYLTATVPAGVKVMLCICDSWDAGTELKANRADLTVWAANGTPALSWDSRRMTVTDTTGCFKEC